MKKITIAAVVVLAFGVLAAVALIGYRAGWLTRPTPDAGPGTVSTDAADLPSAYERLRVHVMRATSDGKSSEIGSIERPLTDFRDLPISILVRKSEQAGATSEGSPAQFEARIDVGRQRMALPSFDLDCSEPAMCIAREWLDLELKAPGTRSQHVERTLFERTDDAGEPPGFRRHTIVVVPDAMSREDVKERVEKAIGDRMMEQGTAKAEGLRVEVAQATPERQLMLLAQLDDLDATGVLGNLIALEHAAESDILTDQLARQLDVTVRRLVPRVLITTFQALDPGDSLTVSLDLRLNEVEAFSPSEGAAELFQHARGVQESEIEGTTLKAFVGGDNAVSTARLMNAANANGIGIFVVANANRGDLASLNLPRGVVTLVNSALDRGHNVMLPRSAVPLAGRSRWGFWDIDPATGATIGVMEGGEYQGIVEGPLITRRVAQSPELGYCTGFMVGIVSSQWGIMAGILKYGGITKELIEELKHELEEIACSNPCNLEVQVKGEVSVNHCKREFKKALSPVPEEWSYCKEYKEGFECAVGTILAGLEHPGHPHPEVKGEATIELGCHKTGPEVGGQSPER